MAAVLEYLTTALDVDPKVAKRFLGSISLFTVFYMMVATLTFRWDQYLGAKYALYAQLFMIDWILMTSSVIVFDLLVNWGGSKVKKEFVEATAIVVTGWDTIASFLVLLAIGVALSLAYYLAGVKFPLTIPEWTYIVPVLTVAAVSETLTYQWFLARAFNTRWRLGYLWASIVFAAAHANLTPMTFVVLVVLSLGFYYLTNPAGNLPFWMNVVFASGIHVIYNVFVLAYGGATGLLFTTSPGSTLPAIGFWVLVVGVVVLVLVGEVRSRRPRRALAG